MAERVGAQLVTFVVSIVLARLLDPSVYGLIAIMNVFIVLSQVFIDSGLGNALIQKKDADSTDFSTVFYTNVLFCAVIYVILFACSPLIAGFYEAPELSSMLRVMGIAVLFAGVKNVQQAYVARNMMFKKFFFSTLFGTITAAVVGITMAFMGCGAWALIAQSLINTAIDTLVLWITVKWRPTREFSFERLMGLFSFGWKILVSTIIDRIYNNLITLIIGKVYNSEDLAYYNQGDKLPNMLITNLAISIDSVLLPTMASEQDNLKRMKEITRRAVLTGLYILAPAMLGLVAVATPLVRLLLTEKWLPCVFYMQVFAVTYMIYTVHTANLNAIEALGRSDIYLKQEVLKTVIDLGVTLVTVFISVKALAISYIFTDIISMVINMWPNKKLIDYGVAEQLKDMAPTVLVALAMAVIIYPVQWLGLPDAVTLLIQVPAGVAIYVLGSKLFKLESFDYVMGIAKTYINKIKHRGEAAE